MGINGFRACLGQENLQVIIPQQFKWIFGNRQQNLIMIYEMRGRFTMKKEYSSPSLRGLYTAKSC